LETNPFAAILFHELLLADSKNDIEEVSKLEEQYNILSCSSFAKYEAYKFYKSEIEKSNEIMPLSNISNSTLIKKAIEESDKLLSLFPIEKNYIGYLFTDGSCSPTLPRHYLFERYILAKLNIDPYISDYSSDILLQAGAIKICVDDILIATQPTKEQNKWLLKNPAKRYHINNIVFKSYIDKEIEKAIKALPYHFTRHSL
jgi:hypothetical protein